MTDLICCYAAIFVLFSNQNIFMIFHCLAIILLSCRIISVSIHHSHRGLTTFRYGNYLRAGKRDLFVFLGRPTIPHLHFTDVIINHTRFLVTWDYPDDNGGVKVIMFTVWFRTVRPINSTVAGKWAKMNATHNSRLLKLNCCLTYELMVTAWNRNGPSFTDPDKAARISVTGGIHVCQSHSYRRVIWSI